MLLELRSTDTLLDSSNFLSIVDITTFVGRNWAADVLTIGPIVYVTPCDAVSALPIPAMVRDRTNSSQLISNLEICVSKYEGFLPAATDHH